MYLVSILASRDLFALAAKRCSTEQAFYAVVEPKYLKDGPEGYECTLDAEDFPPIHVDQPLGSHILFFWLALALALAVLALSSKVVEVPPMGWDPPLVLYFSGASCKLRVWFGYVSYDASTGDVTPNWTYCSKPSILLVLSQ